MKKVAFVSLITIISLIFTVSFIVQSNSLNKIYKVVPFISKSDTENRIDQISFLCTDLRSCDLQGGDVLFRRYITDRTFVFDRLIKPYFTHTAYYIGAGKIFEASGVEKDTKDDVSIKNIENTDWYDSKVEKIVIVRPLSYTKEDLIRIKARFESISDDQSYIFGLSTENTKQKSCAEIIYDVLIEDGVLDPNSLPSKIITPDLLFKIFFEQPEKYQFFKI